MILSKGRLKGVRQSTHVSVAARVILRKCRPHVPRARFDTYPAQRRISLRRQSWADGRRSFARAQDDKFGVRRSFDYGSRNIFARFAASRETHHLCGFARGLIPFISRAKTQKRKGCRSSGYPTFPQRSLRPCASLSPIFSRAKPQKRNVYYSSRKPFTRRVMPSLIVGAPKLMSSPSRLSASFK